MKYESIIAGNEAGVSFTLDSFGGAVPINPSNYLPSPIPGSYSFGMVIVGGGNTAFSVGDTAKNLQRQFNLVDTVSLSRGAHQIKLGVDYRRLTPEFNPKETTAIPWT